SRLLPSHLLELAAHFGLEAGGVPEHLVNNHAEGEEVHENNETGGANEAPNEVVFGAESHGSRLMRCYSFF
ncbi:hypothetical protein, partial [Escherichia coli]|uniref:hypothetical protein n=1 Tax=Escherichia coli TaxID=562 RepID=UPI001BDCD62B